jgi:LPXTG-motif cell wall-anchored protein
MKKSLMLALIGLIFFGGMVKSFAQGDSVTVSEEPKDTISIDNVEPVYYEEKETKEPSSTPNYAFIGGIIVVGGVAFFLIRKKKK